MIVPEKAFVNSFWGQKDAGFSVIQQKIKTSLTTLHEILEFYKERINIEKDYNKRLAKLVSSTTLGSGEIGSLKISLDKLQTESSEMVNQNNKFIRSVSLQNYERLYNFYHIYLKNTQKVENHMQKVLHRKFEAAAQLENAKEKYRTTCGQIKALTLLCQTTWGKELERNSAKLAKLQHNVSDLSRSFQQETSRYQEIHEIWVADWSVALSNIYQLEIERIQLCKLNCFAFCNNIAALCVDWDQSVDAARSSFAKIAAPRDAYDFVEAYGTGNQIPAPPVYVDFLNGFEEDSNQKYTKAHFKDPDYSQILSRTFSAHSAMSGRQPSPTKAMANSGGNGTASVPTNSPDRNRGAYESRSIDHQRTMQLPETPMKPPVVKSLPPIKQPILSPENAGVTPSSGASGRQLQKQPSRNSNYTSGAEDRNDVFDRHHRPQTSVSSSNYSSATNYSSNTGRSWASPRRKSAQEMQKEINRRSKDFSESLANSPTKTRENVPQNVPLAKDFSIDFIAKALEDLNAGGDGDVTKFRKSVRMGAENPRTASENTLSGPAVPTDVENVQLPPSDFVDDSRETATRYDSISFRSPNQKQRKKHPMSPAASNGNGNDEDSLRTVLHNSPRKSAGRSLSQSPTKSYTNLRSFVGKVTPVTNHAYVTKAIAKYSFNSREKGELSFHKGWQMYVIHRQEDKWYVCELGANCGSKRGSVGLVPYNYVAEGDDIF